MKVLPGLFIAGLMACSATAVDDVHDSVETVGPLRLELRDFPIFPGAGAFVEPPVGAVIDAIVVERTQGGSLCQLAVGGTAKIQGAKVELHISFAQRTAVCPQDFRALSYTATVSISPGTYDVTVIHDEGGRADTVEQRQVTVP
jgi:hypothetical protein